MDLWCAGSIPGFIQRECGTELGGIIAIGFIDKDIAINTDNLSATLESAGWWNNSDNSPGSVWVVKPTRGSKAAGTPTEEEGFGQIPTERTGDDKELNVEAPWVMDNQIFFSKINKTRNLGLVYVTAGKDDDGNLEAFYAPNVSVYADTVIDQSIKSRKRWSINCKWSTAMTPDYPFSAPASVFEV
jgi:hypothetical protein